MPIIKLEYNQEKQYCTVPENASFIDVAQIGKYRNTLIEFMVIEIIKNLFYLYTVDYCLNFISYHSCGQFQFEDSKQHREHCRSSRRKDQNR